MLLENKWQGACRATLGLEMDSCIGAQCMEWCTISSTLWQGSFLTLIGTFPTFFPLLLLPCHLPYLTFGHEICGTPRFRQASSLHKVFPNCRHSICLCWHLAIRSDHCTESDLPPLTLCVIQVRIEAKNYLWHREVSISHGPKPIPVVTMTAAPKTTAGVFPTREEAQDSHTTEDFSWLSTAILLCT